MWREKTWKGSKLRRETKSIGSNGKYLGAVATPNREKPKKEEECKAAKFLLYKILHLVRCKCRLIYVRL